MSSANDSYQGRRAARIENAVLRVTVLHEGGHIAEVLHKASGVNPLWTPPWPSIEHSAYRSEAHAIYGSGVDASLLAGIMGHNLCLDIFGGPSAEEAACGLPVHGEASRAPYEVQGSSAALVMRARLPLAGLTIERRIELHGANIRIREEVQNESGIDRPIAWTQHVTLGPPFLERGATLFRASAARSKVFEGDFGADDYLVPGGEFDWPYAPGRDGGTADLRVLAAASRSSAYTTHLMDPDREHAYFVAFSPAARLSFGYVWRRADFPWLGIWEENLSRLHTPWNGRTLARGLEFGVSPFPESRREMVDRGSLFGTPTYRWIPAASRLAVEYWVLVAAGDAIPDTLEWPA
jgi:hypothetical protein